MSSEYIRTPAAIQSESIEHEKLLDTIYEILDEVSQRLESIEANKVTIPETDSEMTEQILLSIYQKNLEILSKLVLDTSEYEEYDPAITIESPCLDMVDAFIHDIYLSDFFAMHEDEIEQRIGPIQRESSEYFLSMLVPNTVEDPEMRSVYFLPWQKNLLKKSFGLSEDEDGSMRFSRPTRLSNICVIYDYAPGKQIPTRTIHLVR